MTEPVPGIRPTSNQMEWRTVRGGGVVFGGVRGWALLYRQVALAALSDDNVENNADFSNKGESSSDGIKI